MKRTLQILSLILIVLSALVSCRAISSFLNDDEVVAAVGSDKLYRHDLDRIIPKGLSVEDSTSLAIQYINTWASELVFLNIAQQQLSKSDRDVSKELEDYRKSLLKYRYENLYINERLDTAVSNEMVEDYFQRHIDKFTLQRPVLKARFLRIPSDSPSLEPIRKRMSSDSPDELQQADSIAFSSALKYNTWDGRWIDAAVLSREFSLDYSSMLSLQKSGWIELTDTTGVTNLAYVVAMVEKGTVAPLDFVTPEIKDIIISTRKQLLLSTLERDLLEEARDNGQFVIY